MTILKPSTKENFYFSRYIDVALKDDLISSLETSRNEVLETLESISEAQSKYKYAEDKWTIKEVVSHCIDTERILSYRALCFSRKEELMLPGFDQDKYANEDAVSGISFADLLQEYNLVRQSTILFFKRMNVENLDFQGIASNVEISPRELGWTIAGHDLHHLKVIREKYLIGNQGSGSVNFNLSMS
ncbi:MAG: DinB family protein [Crocinitomicaceae bacterium]